ncbi:MAG: diaminopimelate decarboxylase [Solirubrobacterales bacterium]|nr:diaminopimelate decarboxylase [Solirubrobacterales bacterium]
MPRSSVTATTDPVTGSPAWPIGTTIGPDGHVVVGGCDLTEIAREFGTPAYVYATDDVRARARAYVDALRGRGVEGEILYASKAAPFTALYRLMREEGLSVDVASGGELHMALIAGFEPDRVYMHGNNKSAAELRMAFDAGIGCVVVDSLEEIALADRLADREQDVLIRLTPGVEPSTHSYVRTGQIDSKFGFGIEGGQAEAAVTAVAASRNLRLAGFHAHLGSQVYELEPYVRAIELMADFCRPHRPRVMNVGGGLGIAYCNADSPPSIEAYVELKVDALRRCFDPLPRILLEPGRSLVGNAGVTIYTVGAVKEIPGVRTYVAVDGGMSDNLRPMLYGSRYEALIANRADRPATVTSAVAGKHCESGDILVRDVALADPRPGDLLATPATGAYGHAMANNYNGVPRPPIVFCSDGRADLVVRRETVEDLVARDV